jgi:hypothetical protein
MTFGNRTIALHLIRGGAGFGALALSIMAPISPWWSIALIPIALIALKGCPICWTIGLVETIALRVHAHHGADPMPVTAAPSAKIQPGR